VVDVDGTKLGTMPIDVALRRATEQGLDLVEVAPNARPPVCKILDYGRHKYELKKKQSEQRKNQTQQELKEVKLRPKTDDHDYDFKLKHVRRFLEANDKVKVTIMFRGREVIHKDIAVNRLKAIAKDVEDLGKVEAMPRMEARAMHMILAPNKGKSDRPKAEKSSPKPAPAADLGAVSPADAAPPAEAAPAPEAASPAVAASPAEAAPPQAAPAPSPEAGSDAAPAEENS